MLNASHSLLLTIMIAHTPADPCQSIIGECLCDTRWFSQTNLVLEGRLGNCATSEAIASF